MRTFPISMLVGLLLLPTARAQEARQKERPRVDRYGDPLPPGAIGRLGSLRFRTGGQVRAMDLSADGKLLVTSGQTGRPERIVIWGVPSGRRIAGLADGLPYGASVSLSPDGSFLAVGGNPRVAGLWELESGEQIFPFPGPPNTQIVSFSPDGKWLATATAAGVVRIRNAITGESVRKIIPKNIEADRMRRSFETLAFSPDSRWLATAFGSIEVMEVDSGKEVLEIDEGPSGGYAALTFWPDGKRLVLVEQTRIRIWDFPSGKKQAETTGLGFTRGAFSRSGKQFAVGAHDGMIRIFDAGLEKDSSLLIGHQYTVSGVAFLPGDETLISTGWDGTIRIWDLARGKQVNKSVGHEGRIQCLAFSPDGKALASGGSDRTIRLWNLDTFEEVLVLQGHESQVQAIAFSPDGSRLVSGGQDKVVVLWDTESGRSLQRMPGHDMGVASVAFSPDGKNVASGSYDRTVRIWSVLTGEAIRRLEGHGNYVGPVTYSPDGLVLASGEMAVREGPATIILWNLAEGQPMRKIASHERSIVGLKFSTDGKRLFSWGADQKLLGWQIPSGESIESGPHIPSGWSACALSSDSAWAALLRYGSGWELVELATGSTAFEPSEPTGFGGAIAFSPDGSRVAAGDTPTSILIWDLSPIPDSPDAVGTAEALWGSLADEDGRRAFEAIWWLAEKGDEAVTFIRDRLLEEPAPELIRGRIANLASKDFTVRQTAFHELKGLGTRAEGMLRETLLKDSAPEVGPRIRDLLSALHPPYDSFPSETLRRLRSIGALERIDTELARTVLKALRDRSTSEREREAARLALARLEHR
ncbi:MAG: WD40 repeat domain-containing protein [Planctomycetota bacterium]|nr:WD40 repeat domain-containing protein [Planctomycetota bacterium]